jgi:hypothetical protein
MTVFNAYPANTTPRDRRTRWSMDYYRLLSATQKRVHDHLVGKHTGAASTRTTRVRITVVLSLLPLLVSRSLKSTHLRGLGCAAVRVTGEIARRVTIERCRNRRRFGRYTRARRYNVRTGRSSKRLRRMLIEIMINLIVIIPISGSRHAVDSYP